MAKSIVHRLQSIYSKLQAYRNKLRQDINEKKRLILRSVVVLFVLLIALFILGPLPLPIQQPFEADFVMKEVGFVYSSEREKERRLVGSISEIDCIRFDGISKWSPEGQISQSSNDPKLIGQTAITFDLSEVDSRLFLGSCSSLKKVKQSRDDQLEIKEIIIPNGTTVDYLIYTPKQDLQLGLVLPKKKESRVKVTTNSRSPLDVTIENAKLAGGKLLPIAKLVIDDIKKPSQTLKLKTQNPVEIASIKASFSKELTDQWDDFATELKIDNFKLYKTEHSVNPENNRRISLIKNGSIRINGKDFVYLSENPDKNAISSDTTDIEIIGGKIEHLESLKITKTGLKVYVTGKSRAIRVNSQRSNAVTLFNILPGKFLDVIIAGLVSSLFSLVIWLIQKWIE
ncbi:MAG: hypothetical protein F6K21_25775 [Symploca sp. SIO2D2]|nr:hypothetical protein [Symploca sp. SIO2D2]